jgi:hypothetical protein
VKIVGYAGRARSGKNAAAQFSVQDWGAQQYAWADNLRKALLTLDPMVEAENTCARLSRIIEFLGWDKAKVDIPEIRRLMQVFGTEVGRQIVGPNVWVDSLLRKIEQEKPDVAVITDCRFPNELAAIRDRGGYTVWVERPGIEAVNGHVSESSIGPEDCTHVIKNDGDLINLRQRVYNLHERFNVLWALRS